MNSRKASWWSIACVLMLGTITVAQVPSHIAIESGNNGSVLAPTDPNGYLNIGPCVWVSDSKGILSYITEAGNPAPLETGIYGFSLTAN